MSSYPIYFSLREDFFVDIDVFSYYSCFIQNKGQISSGYFPVDQQVISYLNPQSTKNTFIIPKTIVLLDMFQT